MQSNYPTLSGIHRPGLSRRHNRWLLDQLVRCYALTRSVRAKESKSHLNSNRKDNISKSLHRGVICSKPQKLALSQSSANKSMWVSLPIHKYLTQTVAIFSLLAVNKHDNKGLMSRNPHWGGGGGRAETSRTPKWEWHISLPNWLTGSPVAPSASRKCYFSLSNPLH